MHRHIGPAPGITVWDDIEYHSRTPLVRIAGTLNSQRYISEVLEPVVLPYLQGLAKAIFQQDNASFLQCRSADLTLGNVPKNRVLKKAAYKGYQTISYEAVFAISGIPPNDLVILNNLDVQENYLSTNLDTLDGTIPVSLLSRPSCRKPITLVTYTKEVFQEYKTVCFTDGSKLNGRAGLACVIYEEGVENVTFQHRLRDECSVFQAELLCINLVVKLIQDSLSQSGKLKFLICTD
ncbi:RNase H domain-containing protein [Trichonephila clavipes]|nr:RNase H domain-containing protein [Trichonephila clavipes]